MKTVSIASSFAPYHIAFADVIYFSLLDSSSPFLANTTFWNGLATLQQQGMQQQQLAEFLDRISKRLSATALPDSGTQTMGSQLRSGGPSATKMLEYQETINEKVCAFAASAEQTNESTLSVPDNPDQPEFFKYLLEQVEIANRIVSALQKKQLGVSLNNDGQNIAVEKNNLLKFKQVFVLLYNVGKENAGIHTILTENRNKVLIFESDQDATKFSEILENNDLPRPVVKAVEVEYIEKFCKDKDYDWELVLKGAPIVPPASNANMTDQ